MNYSFLEVKWIAYLKPHSLIRVTGLNSFSYTAQFTVHGLYESRKKWTIISEYNNINPTFTGKYCSLCEDFLTSNRGKTSIYADDTSVLNIEDKSWGAENSYIY